MATLPAEQVTQRNKIGVVQITDGTEATTIGETLWLSTTTLPYTVVDTKSVVSNQQVRQTLEDRIMADYYDEREVAGGEDVSDRTLVKLGNTTLSVGNSTVGTKDISAFVAGGFGTLHYSIDATSEDDYGTSQMAGDTLVYTSGASDGADDVKINVTDDGGSTVQVTCVVTVA